MSGLRDTISHKLHEWDHRISQWATPRPQARATPPSSPEPVRLAHTESTHLGHVSEQDLASAIAALKNMKQLSAWVKHESAGFEGYASGGVKTHHREKTPS